MSMISHNKQTSKTIVLKLKAYDLLSFHKAQQALVNKEVYMST